MRVIARKALKVFWEKPGRADAEQPLKAWFKEVRNASWNNPTDVKRQYRNASILKNNRVVFNIAGNKYRLVVAVNYKARLLFIRFIGTHVEYDLVNAEEV